MGVHPNIGADRFPRQGGVGRAVRVCFDYDIAIWLKGTLIRDDMEEPLLTIFQLEDGRVVLSTECQWQFQE